MFKKFSLLLVLIFIANTVIDPFSGIITVTAKTTDETNINSSDLYDNFKYSLNNDGTASITGYAGTEQNIEIPNKITKDNIDYNVTSINCSTSFSTSRIYTLNIPESISQISDESLKNMNNIKTIKVNENNPIFESSNGILYNKQTKTLLLCPSKEDYLTVKEGYLHIGNYAFNDYLPYAISFLDTTEAEFNNENYYKTILTSDPNTDYCRTKTEFVRKGELLYYNFDEYDLYEDNCLVDNFEVNKNASYTLLWKTSYTIKESNNYTYSINNYNSTAMVNSYTGKEKDIQIPDTLDIDGHKYKINGINRNAFEKSNISSVIIPEGIKFIASDAFSSCLNLEKVILPKSLKRINGFAFYNCTSLKDINLPEGIEALEEKVFSKSSIETINIPATIHEINYSSFENSPKLKSINVNKDNPVFESSNGILYNKQTKTLLFCPLLKDETFNVKEGYLNMYPNAFNNNSPLYIRFFNTDKAEFKHWYYYNYYKVTLTGDDYIETQFVKTGGNEVIFDHDKYDLYDDNGLVTDYTINEDQNYTLIDKGTKDACHLNKDDKIYAADLSLMASAYNATSENEDFNNPYDINNDNICDIYDITKLAAFME